MEKKALDEWTELVSPMEVSDYKMFFFVVDGLASL